MRTPDRAGSLAALAGPGRRAGEPSARAAAFPSPPRARQGLRPESPLSGRPPDFSTARWIEPWATLWIGGGWTIAEGAVTRSQEPGTKASCAPFPPLAGPRAGPRPPARPFAAGDRGVFPRA